MWADDGATLPNFAPCHVSREFATILLFLEQNMFFDIGGGAMTRHRPEANREKGRGQNLGKSCRKGD